MDKVVVLFEVTFWSSGQGRYEELAAEFRSRMPDIEGYLGGDRFQSADGQRFLSIHLWENEQAVDKWRNDVDHRLAQLEAREKIYADYKLTVARCLRQYSKAGREDAPADSNERLIGS